MSALEVFDYAGTQVRTVLVDGEPWFVAADVARVLGYSATAAMTRSLDEDEKGVRTLHTPGGDQEMTVVNEPGLYGAVVRSTIPQARAFKRWVTHEVLPQIRRTGEFRQTEVEHALPASYAAALRQLAERVEEVEALEAKAAADAPKVAAYDALMDADGYYSMDAVAKIGGMGRTTLFTRLRAAGVIEATSRLPYSRYAHWFKVTASTYQRSGVTQTDYAPRVLPDALDKVLAKADAPVLERVS